MAITVKKKSAYQVAEELGLKTNGNVLNWFTSECARYIDPFVPMDKGELRKYYIVGNEIHYGQRYADYQYEGISKSGKPLNYSKDKHPLATHHWDIAMQTARGDDLTRSLQDYINRG